MALFFLGCGDDAGGDDQGAAGAGAEADPAELVCDEVDESGTPIVASTARDASAPEIEVGAEPYAVELPDGEAGYVRVEIDGDTAAILLVAVQDVVTGLYLDDQEEDLMSAGPDTFCAADIEEHFDVDFHEAGTYYLRLGPSALNQVWLFLSGAEGHGHH